MLLYGDMDNRQRIPSEQSVKAMTTDQLTPQ
jgi:hypothetical protein